jgi:hypothetical protein
MGCHGLDLTNRRFATTVFFLKCGLIINKNGILKNDMVFYIYLFLNNIESSLKSTLNYMRGETVSNDIRISKPKYIKINKQFNKKGHTIHPEYAKAV